MNWFQMIASYSLLVIGIFSLITYWITKKFILKKMNRTIMNTEHSYQQQIASLQTQLSGKVNTLESMVNKLRLSNQELMRLNDIRSKFMAVVAHDLRQPLSSIQGFASFLMLDNNPQTETSKSDDQLALNNILKATENMNLLMSDLMDISLIESGKFKLDYQNFSFNALIRDVVNLQMVNAQKHGVFLQTQDYPTDVMVEADRFRISQVLNNLIGNAIKFSAKEGIVEIRYLPKDGQLICRVTDQGPGIVHTELGKVFQKFHQSTNDRNLKKQGWGLGLAIAQEIVFAHSGDICANSPGIGQGAIFTFSIPLVKTIAKN